MLDTIVHWVRATSASNWINQTIWIWPLCETIHFIGLSLLLGAAGFFDLRLMGFFRSIPVASARAFMPFGIAGFVMNLLTGLVFLIGLPEQYAHNSSWWLKVLFLALAGMNALVFETRLAAQAVKIAPGADMPVAMKLVGAFSLFSWVGVLYWGRMLPFIGNAF